MATVEEIVRDIAASTPTTAGGLLISKWIDNRYKEMVSKVKFRHLRKVGELSLPAVIDTGTATATRDSTAITGIASTFQTEVGAGAQTDYYFRSRTAWYKIASIGGELALTLSSNFAEDSVSAVAYHIVKRTHSLASDARWLGDFYHTRLRKQLDEISLDALNIKAPGRSLVGNIPQYVAQVGVDSNGYPSVEIYPPPENSEIIHYIYWALPSALSIGSTIPSVIDPYTLKEGALVDLYRFEKMMALKAGNIEAAAVMRNDEMKQETNWAGKIRDAIRTSRGADDISIILEMFHGNERFARCDQRTARDYVFDNWSR